MDNVLKNENLKDSDVRNLLNKFGGVVDNVQQSHYTELNNANEWSRFKPIRSKRIDYTLAEWLERGKTGKFGEDECFGFEIPVFESPASIMRALENGAAMWEYKRPDGKVYPYRTGDWRGYNPEAVNPVGDVVEKVYLQETTTGFYFDVNVDVVVAEMASEYNLCLADFEVNGVRLSDMYLGVYLKRSGGKYYFQTGDRPIGSDGLTTTIKTDNNAMGEYVAYLFLSSKPQTGMGQEADFVSINKGGSVFAIVKDGKPYVFAVGYWRKRDGVVQDIFVDLHNESEHEFIFENITVNLVKVEKGKKPEEGTSMTPIKHGESVKVEPNGYVSVRISGEYTGVFEDEGYDYYMVGYADNVEAHFEMLEEADEGVPMVRRKG